MANQLRDQAKPGAARTEPIVAVASPDVNQSSQTSAAGATPAGPAPGVGDGLLQDLLPEISALAQKVGGFKRLAEIAAQLDRGNPPQ
jgi:hypothetical protein